MASANALQDEMHDGDRAAQAVRLEAGLELRPASKREFKLFAQCAITLLRGWMGDDIDAIVDYWEADGGRSMTPMQHAAAVVRLRGVQALLAPLRATIERDSLDMTELLWRLGAMRTGHPGQRLVMSVGSALQQDPRRRRLRSDWVDLDHVAHFPYVDIATCDAGTYHAVTRALADIELPRAVCVIPNGNLAEVVATLVAAAGVVSR